MADYMSRRVRVTRYEWRIPRAEFGGPGAVVAEVYKVLSAAEVAWRGVYGKEPAYDDWLRVWAADDDVVFWFLGEEEQAADG